MKQRTIKGFVLRRRPYKEFNLLVTIFTENEGVIKVVARGVLRAKAKIRSFLEPFVLTKFRLAKGKGFDILIGAYTSKANLFFNLDTKNATAAYVLTELIERTAAEGQPNQQLFNIYHSFLSRFSNDKDPLKILNYFFLKTLKSLGIQPRIDVSSDQKEYFLYLNSGEVGLNRPPSNDYVVLNREVLKLWNVFTKYDFKIINRLKAKNIVYYQSLGCLVCYVEYHFHIRLKSYKVFQETTGAL